MNGEFFPNSDFGNTDSFGDGVTVNKRMLNTMSYDIVGFAMEVRKNAGRYFREHYYAKALKYELEQGGYSVQEEVTLPARYKNILIENSYRIDLVVEDQILIEIKAMPLVGNKEFRQLLSYLKLSSFPIGFLINFGCEDFRLATHDNIFNQECGIYRFLGNFHQ